MKKRWIVVIGILILVNIISILVKNPFLAFFSYVAIFIIFLLKTYPKTKIEYKNRNFVKAGLYLIMISLILIVIYLVDVRTTLMELFMYGPILYYISLISYLILLINLIYGTILIFFGIFSIEKDKIPSSKKVGYGLLIIGVILIIFLLVDTIFPATNILPIILKNIVVKTGNENLCSLVPSGNIYWQEVIYSEYGQLDESCYTETAILKKDVGSCDKLGEVVGPLLDYVKYQCYTEVAIITKDESLCGLIPQDTSWGAGCYTALAITEKDESLCYKVKEMAQSRCLDYYKEGEIKSFSFPGIGVGRTLENDKGQDITEATPIQINIKP